MMLFLLLKMKLCSVTMLLKRQKSAGANISQLMIKLNNAGSLLSRSELAYSNGDFASASSLAVQSQNELAGFCFDANSFRLQLRKVEPLIFC